LISADNYVPVSWAKGIDLETGRPIIDEQAARYEDGKLKIVRPSGAGGHNWQPMSYNPRTGLVYIPAMINAWSYKQAASIPGLGPGIFNIGNNGGLIEPFKPGTKPEDANTLDFTREADVEKLRTTWQGKLIAWDPVRQKEVWSRPHPSMWNGATLTTAGNLVFQGTGSGKFAAYRASDGKPLWESNASNTGVIAAPISYMVDNEQYIAVAAGGSGPLIYMGLLAPNPAVQPDARILVYKVGGKASIPPGNKPRPLPSAFPFTIDPAKAKIGRGLYGGACTACHGIEAISSGTLPDLRYLDADTIANFPAIIHGAYGSVGMPDFTGRFSYAQIEAILHYLAQRNAELRARLGK
ncbi:MAG: c-type cytochrome, partial [Parvibaculaceae bacterium]